MPRILVKGYFKNHGSPDGDTIHFKRLSTTRDFFIEENTPKARAVAAMNTPAIAKRWHFSLNMPLESMRSVFEKQAKVDALRAH